MTKYTFLVQGTQIALKMQSGNLLKINEKGEAKSEMHRWSIFDGFGIEFGAIFETKNDQKSIANEVKD